MPTHPTGRNLTASSTVSQWSPQTATTVTHAHVHVHVHVPPGRIERPPPVSKTDVLPLHYEGPSHSHQPLPGRPVLADGIEPSHPPYQSGVGKAPAARAYTNARTPVAASVSRALHAHARADCRDPTGSRTRTAMIRTSHPAIGTWGHVASTTHTHTHTQPPADRRGVAPRSLARQASVLLMHQRTKMAAAADAHTYVTQRPKT